MLPDAVFLFASFSFMQALATGGEKHQDHLMCWFVCLFHHSDQCWGEMLRKMLDAKLPDVVLASRVQLHKKNGFVLEVFTPDGNRSLARMSQTITVIDDKKRTHYRALWHTAKQLFQQQTKSVFQAPY
ncbi:hypothetical protein BaRGS_00040249 [Batillaria attramentaria]|uniref:Uncharacterized protein n=1 Tax=Batillaria attramentaria TaxID=370345 RepID=A0ABD0J0R2_9CAEN